MSTNTKSNSKNIKFIPYEDDPLDGGSPGTPFYAHINPESFKHSRSINVNSDDVSNTAFDVYQFKGYGKETLSMQLILDGTGYTNSSKTSVVDQLHELLDVIYYQHGEAHKPNYVGINWGRTKASKPNIFWHCETVDTNFVLFTPTGDPLIAEVDLSFVIHRNKEQEMKNTPLFSPDMTHIHVFRQGDSLPAMCKDIYDDVAYYVQIAEINGITNFRNIPTGKNLFFPPLLNKD